MKKILIVEDDENLCLLYEKELSEEGYKVVLAKSGKEAIKKARTERPDIIVMDIRIPGGDGIETMHEIKTFAKNIPIILNTAYPIYQQDFSTWLAAAYVVKSADLSVLKKTISETIANLSSPLS
jgi:CheY-like chemotaxis protein